VRREQQCCLRSDHVRWALSASKGMAFLLHDLLPPHAHSHEVVAESIKLPLLLNSDASMHRRWQRTTSRPPPHTHTHTHTHTHACTRLCHSCARNPCLLLPLPGEVTSKKLLADVDPDEIVRVRTRQGTARQRPSTRDRALPSNAREPAPTRHVLLASKTQQPGRAVRRGAPA
jgi:hypothetical protein